MFLFQKRNTITTVIEIDQNKMSPPGGLEPPTFRLTAERANQLRHEGLHMSLEKQKNNISVILLVYTRNT